MCVMDLNVTPSLSFLLPELMKQRETSSETNRSQTVQLSDAPPRLCAFFSNMGFYRRRMRRVRIRIQCLLRSAEPGCSALHPHRCRDARHVGLDGEEMHGWRFRPDKPFMGSSRAGLRRASKVPPPNAAPGQKPMTLLPS